MRTRSARIERRASFRYTQKGLHSPAEENSRHAPRAYFDLHFMRAPDFIEIGNQTYYLIVCVDRQAWIGARENLNDFLVMGWQCNNADSFTRMI